MQWYKEETPQNLSLQSIQVTEFYQPSSGLAFFIISILKQTTLAYPEIL